MGSYQIRYHAFTGALSSLTGSFPLYCPYVLTPASTWVILRGWCVVLGHPNQSRFMLHILRAALNKANPPGWYNSDPILFRMAAFSICKSDLRFKMLDGERTIMDKIISWMHTLPQKERNCMSVKKSRNQQILCNTYLVFRFQRTFHASYTKIA